MRNKQELRTGTKVALALVLSLALSTSGDLMAQEKQHPHQSSEAMDRSEGGMMERCQAMAAKHDEMSAHMDAMYEKIDSLRAEMDAAEGDAKTDALAAIVNEMVAQHKSMGTMMMQAQPRMMKHMMAHMSSGMGDMGQGGMKSMQGCPMMKKMSMDGDAEEVGEDDHSEHHQDS